MSLFRVRVKVTVVEAHTVLRGCGQTVKVVYVHLCMYTCDHMATICGNTAVFLYIALSVFTPIECNKLTGN